MKILYTAKNWGPLIALMLVVALSFWLSPAPQGIPNEEYWGEYVRVGPGLGFVLNHDSQGYIDVAQHPSQLVHSGEVRQSRPLYALLGAAIGYPLTVALRVTKWLGLLPNWSLTATSFWGYYWGYVLLNGLTLLGSLLLLRHLVRVLAGSQAPRWLFWALAWVLVATPITKTFFWTAHQQLLAFFVPLFCLSLGLWLRRLPVLRAPLLAGLSLTLGLLPLAYGSFVLVGAALVFGLARSGPAAGVARWGRAIGQLAVAAALFATPTLLWIGLLRLQGVAYYNHEAVRYHQLVWLPEARYLPASDFWALLGSKLRDYLSSLQVVGGWVLLATGLLAATWWRQRRTAAPLLPTLPARALAWMLGSFGLFFALLGYYPERLAYTLLPLLLCLLAGLVPHWPPRYARPLVLAGAAGWHLYVLLSYGPFS